MAISSAAATQQPQPDFDALKARQHGAWSSGDYAVVGTTLQIVGEELCEALDLRAGQRVLDVAAGNGNVTLAAARRRPPRVSRWNSGKPTPRHCRSMTKHSTPWSPASG
jgi:hypothetical protein